MDIWSRHIGAANLGMVNPIAHTNVFNNTKSQHILFFCVSGLMTLELCWIGIFHVDNRYKFCGTTWWGWGPRIVESHVAAGNWRLFFVNSQQSHHLAVSTNPYRYFQPRKQTSEEIVLHEKPVIATKAVGEDFHRWLIYFVLKKLHALPPPPTSILYFRTLNYWANVDTNTCYGSRLLYYVTSIWDDH